MVFYGLCLLFQQYRLLLPQQRKTRDLLRMRNNLYLLKKHFTKVTMSKTYFSLVSNRTRKDVYKRQLLNALESGVYNHIAGDGREYVITDATALKLRAEDGRCIKNVDISLFINDLPNRKDTHSFSTENASGSTSQAANVMEGIEAGSDVFLIDEDTTATNFMVRDELMQQIITREKEPITPFLERIRDLYEKGGISTILVAGSSGSYFYAADTISQKIGRAHV